MNDQQATSPKVWVGCLASYNAGNLFGEWVDLGEGFDHFEEELARILEASPEPYAEEPLFADFEAFPFTLSGEPTYCDIRKACEWYAWLEEQGETPQTLAALEVAHDLRLEPEEALELWAGEGTRAEFAEQWMDDLGEWDQLPEHLRYYIDLDAYGRDLAMDHYRIGEGRHTQWFRNE
ncbi:MAG: antirestriction protein ArdA [Planctomycetota bacterium]|jgi:antirestriction protein